MKPRLIALLALVVATVPACSATEADSQESDLASSDVASVFAAVRADAVRLAGEPGDIPQRAVFLHEIFVDSSGNHAFPEVALHGALWAKNFFSEASELESVAVAIGLTDIGVLSRLQAAGEEFGLALQTANRQVFIDTYTNYYFTKRVGAQPGADRFVQRELLDALNAMHLRTAARDPLTQPERRALFLRALAREQEETVAPRVAAAVAAIDPPEARPVFLRPIVRFSYFPFGTVFFFDDFSNKAERIARATDAYDLAEQVGWPDVADAMRDYGTLPDEYFADRAGYAQRLRSKLLGRP
jgi:hypothetical protein